MYSAELNKESKTACDTTKYIIMYNNNNNYYFRFPRDGWPL